MHSDRMEIQFALDAAAWARAELNFDPDPIQEDVLSGGYRRLILNCTRQWGKSTVTAAKALHHALFNEGSLTVVVSPSARQSAEFVRKASGFLRRLKIKPRGDGDNDISLMLPNESRIVGLPGTEGTVRGFSAVSLLIVDEASRVGDAQYHGVAPMLAVSDGDVWLISTPCGKRGFFHDLWAKGGPDWRRVSVAATDCPRIPAAFLEEQRATMGDLWFRQEFLCEFVDVENSLFDREVLLRAVREDVKPLWG